MTLAVMLKPLLVPFTHCPVAGRDLGCGAAIGLVRVIGQIYLMRVAD
jgi:hypothetical protein